MTKKSGFALLVLGMACSLSAWGAGSQYDLIIRGGRIYDGSGGQPYVADVAIKGDRIAAIGKVSGRAARTLDAKGLYVAPGFIDIHNHTEFPVGEPERYPVLNYLRQGVSTVVTGPDGDGNYRIAEYFARLKQHGIGLNVLHTVEHNFIREEAMGGSFDRPPTPAEMARMKAMVRQAMQEGAVGLSSGLYYTPGTYATTEEVIELARVAGEYGGIYTSHIRDEGDFLYDDPRKDGLLDAVREAIRIGKEAGVVANITHIKAEGILGESHWGKSVQVTQLIEQARAQGQRVYADQYPYTASSTSLSAVVVPRWIQADGRMNERLRDPALRARIVEEMRLTVEGGLGPKVLVVSRFESHPEWEGKNLEEISRLMQRSPTETAIEVVLMGDPDMVVHSMSPQDVERFMTKPYVGTSSDGGNPVFGEGQPHPRSYGSFPHKIREYVLEKKVLSMEAAIRAATALPAEVLSLKDRGTLAEGKRADVVVFDPVTIRDEATFSRPHQYSVGIAYLLVNGTIAIDHDEYTGARAGRALARSGGFPDATVSK